MSDASEGPGRANEPPDDGRWLTTGETAKMLGVSLATVRRMTGSGALRFKRVASWTGRTTDVRGHALPGHRLVDRESVVEVLAARRSAGDSPGADS